MQIAFFETSPEEQEFLQKLFAGKLSTAKLTFNPAKLDSSTLEEAKRADIISIFINSEIKKEVIDQLPNLKLITTRSTGFDHIDVAACASKKIVVSNVPAYGSRTVAEYAFALMLGLTRKTMAAYHHVKERHDFDFSDFRGFNLTGKTLGIIGTGRIGLNVAQIAIRGFEMKVIAYDPYPNEAKAKELGFQYADLDTLLQNSDIVSIHAPYNQSTHHLINQNNVGKFKKGALLINTARGEIVDTEALLYALKNQILDGVALDVLEGERQLKEELTRLTEDQAASKMHADQIKILLEDHMLIDMPQVAITPHMAFFTTEAKQEILHTTFENIAAFAENKTLNTVK